MSEMQKDLPYVEVRTPCPLCKNGTINRYLKQKAFKPIKVDRDHHVLEYEVLTPSTRGVRPEFYHVWFCPSCKLADVESTFREPEKFGTNPLDFVSEKIHILSKNPDGLLAKLGAQIDFSKFPASYTSALCAHILAIYLQELLSANRRDDAKLGSLYLRTAWLFRDVSTGLVEAGTPPEGATSHEAYLQTFADVWEDIPCSEKECLSYAIEYYDKSYNNQSRVDDIKGEIDTLFLLADLQLRREDFSIVMKLINLIFRTASTGRNAAKHALQNASKHSGVSSEILQGLETKAKWCQLALERSSDMREEVLDAIYASEIDRAKKVAAAVKPLNIKSVAIALAEHGFHDITQKRLVVWLQSEMNKKSGRAKKEGKESGDTTSDSNEEEGKSGGGFLSRIKGWRK